MTFKPKQLDPEAVKIFSETEVGTLIENIDDKLGLIVGAAEGEKITAVGMAEANVIKQKTEAMDPEKYAMVEIARALAGSGFKLVPEIVAGGGDAGSGGSLVNILLAQLVANNANGKTKPELKK